MTLVLDDFLITNNNHIILENFNYYATAKEINVILSPDNTGKYLSYIFRNRDQKIYGDKIVVEGNIYVDQTLVVNTNDYFIIVDSIHIQDDQSIYKLLYDYASIHNIGENDARVAVIVNEALNFYNLTHYKHSSLEKIDIKEYMFIKYLVLCSLAYISKKKYIIIPYILDKILLSQAKSILNALTRLQKKEICVVIISSNLPSYICENVNMNFALLSYKKLLYYGKNLKTFLIDSNIVNENIVDYCHLALYETFYDIELSQSSNLGSGIKIKDFSRISNIRGIQLSNIENTEDASISINMSDTIVESLTNDYIESNQKKLENIYALQLQFIFNSQEYKNIQFHIWITRIKCFLIACYHTITVENIDMAKASLINATVEHQGKLTKSEKLIIKYKIHLIPVSYKKIYAQDNLRMNQNITNYTFETNYNPSFYDAKSYSINQYYSNNSVLDRNLNAYNVETNQSTCYSIASYLQYINFKAILTILLLPYYTILKLFKVISSLLKSGNIKNYFKLQFKLTLAIVNINKWNIIIYHGLIAVITSLITIFINTRNNLNVNFPILFETNTLQNSYMHILNLFLISAFAGLCIHTYMSKLEESIKQVSLEEKNLFIPFFLSRVLLLYIQCQLYSIISLVTMIIFYNIDSTAFQALYITMSRGFLFGLLLQNLLFVITFPLIIRLLCGIIILHLLYVQSMFYNVIIYDYPRKIKLYLMNYFDVVCLYVVNMLSNTHHSLYISTIFTYGNIVIGQVVIFAVLFIFYLHNIDI